MEPTESTDLQFPPAEWTGISDRDRLAYAYSCSGNEPYELGEESQHQPGIPQGQIHEHRLRDCTVYPGVPHHYWVYVPAQYDRSADASLLVFLDGQIYLGPEVNTPAVLDNLIAAGDIPSTIAVFVDPGLNGPGLPVYGGSDNRSREYDSLGGDYAKFLLEDLLPGIEQSYRITAEPTRRGICGISSGGSCAFTVAWERPDAFGNVISHCGSFTNIRGGHAYPSLIRRSEKKPLRVFLQTGHKDLNIVFGDWEIANRDMAAALQYRGYDCRLEVGQGGHSPMHGAAILPETLRWLWRDDDGARNNLREADGASWTAGHSQSGTP
ncbi:alpha/beta hydrolase [Streptomyces sp. NBC_00582]|uniref:alpha/beta hydrolase n=1 Tax=Streptomyces sp. NBC_00582 TaxID=2975783 RepID=UPI0010E0EB1A|nr:alpha/beta hydrolase-fold protein [Streptomyces sp. NBC_00582]WUB59158.1 alpha/beta hydrolase-fold protein [Streptomyces sp. NBC_00582]